MLNWDGIKTFDMHWHWLHKISSFDNFRRLSLFHTNKWKGFQFQWLKGSQTSVIWIQGNFIHGSKKTSWGLQNLYYFQATRKSLVVSWIRGNMFSRDHSSSFQVCDGHSNLKFSQVHWSPNFLRIRLYFLSYKMQQFLLPR